MKKILDRLINQAIKIQAKIIFPECHDLRTLKALETITKKKICQPILIGNRTKIIQKSLQQHLNIDFSICEFIDPSDPILQAKFSQQLFKLREKKGLTLPNAKLLTKDINYFGVLCLYNKMGQAIVSGASSSTADTLRPAFQIIGTKSSKSLASGCFVMLLPDRVLLFADCAVNIDPTAQDIAQTAIYTAETAQLLKLKPKIGLLSFSTHGSANHPMAQKMATATAILHKKAPHLYCDGEIQADVALVPSIAKYKSPHSKIQGDADILIFPDLQSGNISYKLIERLAGAKAIGTIIQGLKKPVNDLSRGCNAEDIINLTAVTAIQTTSI